MMITIKDTWTDRELTFLNVIKAFEDKGGVKVYIKEKDGTTTFCHYNGFYIMSVIKEW